MNLATPFLVCLVCPAPDNPNRAPCASATGGSTSFPSLNAGSAWAGSLPTGEALADMDCSLIDFEAPANMNIETTAAADPVGPAVASYT